MVSGPPSAVPSFGRMMIFIDGENLAFRYQQMLEMGYVTRPEVVHVRDVFVWCPPRPHLAGQHVILRATYYTYATGSDEYIHSIREQLKQLTYPRASRSFLLIYIRKYLRRLGVMLKVKEWIFRWRLIY